jgi:hypothetical protein
MPNTQPGPPEFDFEVCSPRVLGKLLNVPPYFLLMGHTFLAPLLKLVLLRCRVTHCRLFVRHDPRTVHVEKLPLCPQVFSPRTSGLLRCYHSTNAPYIHLATVDVLKSERCAVPLNNALFYFYT